MWLHLWGLLHSAWHCHQCKRFTVFFMLCNFVLLLDLMVLFWLVRMLLSGLLLMKMMSLRLRISLIIALAMVAWNTLLSGMVTLSLNPLGNRPLTYIVHAFCWLIIKAEGCIKAMGGGDVRFYFYLLLLFVVLCALLRSTIALL